MKECRDGIKRGVRERRMREEEERKWKMMELRRLK